jgi:anti-sigma B factor antagonist
MEQLRAYYRVLQGHVLVRLSGSLTMLTMDSFKRSMQEAAESSGLWKFIMDVSAVDLIDSNGLGALVSASKKATANGGYVRLLNTHRGLQDSLRVTKLEKMFPHFHSLDEALGKSPPG